MLFWVGAPPTWMSKLYPETPESCPAPLAHTRPVLIHSDTQLGTMLLKRYWPIKHCRQLWPQLFHKDNTVFSSMEMKERIPQVRNCVFDKSATKSHVKYWSTAFVSVCNEQRGSNLNHNRVMSCCYAIFFAICQVCNIFKLLSSELLIHHNISLPVIW